MEKLFLNADVRQTLQGERIDVQIDPDTIKVMSRPDADDALRRFADVLNPWGAAGSVPTKQGPYELRTRSGDGTRVVLACWLSIDGWSTEPWPSSGWPGFTVPDARRYGYEFRPRRVTP